MTFKIVHLLVNKPCFLKQFYLTAVTCQFALYLLSKFLNRRGEKMSTKSL